MILACCQYSRSELVSRSGYLHGVNQRRLALETIGDFLADLVEEIIKWNAEKKNLQNLFGVSRAITGNLGWQY
jgi:hypothetical protein